MTAFDNKDEALREAAVINAAIDGLPPDFTEQDLRDAIAAERAKLPVEIKELVYEMDEEA